MDSERDPFPVRVHQTKFVAKNTLSKNALLKNTLFQSKRERERDGLKEPFLLWRTESQARTLLKISGFSARLFSLRKPLLPVIPGVWFSSSFNFLFSNFLKLRNPRSFTLPNRSSTRLFQALFDFPPPWYVCFKFDVCHQNSYNAVIKVIRYFCLKTFADNSRWWWYASDLCGYFAVWTMRLWTAVITLRPALAN